MGPVITTSNYKISEMYKIHSSYFRGKINSLYKWSHTTLFGL